MGYVVGVDLGTTFTAAAVMRDGQPPETVQLGNRAASMPSTVFLCDDHTVLTGHAALRRGLADPGRLAREFKRRFGDPAPLLLGGVPVAADVLTGRMLRATLDTVAEREGGPADAVAVCHPANWGPYKLDLLDQACRHAGLDDEIKVSEPEAAAIHYAAQERLEPGALVAVYDLGGGTFDAAVLRRTDDGFEILGSPDGIERLGGIDFDEAVVAHIRRALGDALADLDAEDPATLSTLARVRDECVEAKEALSGDTEASVSVVLPGLQTDVRITRVEFEAMIRVPLSETIESLRRALRNAAIEPEQLAAVLLVGGSSRIPMVAEMIGAELGRPVAVDADPKHVVALGAARVAAQSRVPPPKKSGRGASPSTPASSGTGDSTASSGTGPGRRRPRKGLLVAGAFGIAALVAGGALALGGGGGGAGGDNAGPDRTTAAVISACPPEGDPAVCITDASFAETLIGDELAVEFTSHDVDLGGDLVPVFFLTDVGATEAGSADERTSDLKAWDAPSPFQGTNANGQRGFTASEIAGARTVCVLIGSPDGRAAKDSGNCAELPSTS